MDENVSIKDLLRISLLRRFLKSDQQHLIKAIADSKKILMIEIETKALFSSFFGKQPGSVSYSIFILVS